MGVSAFVCRVIYQASSRYGVLIDHRYRIACRKHTNIKEKEMNFKRRKQLISKATLILIAIGFFVLQVDAQKQSEQIEVPGETAMAWVAYGELIRFRAFNPSQTASGKPNESISVQLKAFDEHGVLLRETPTVVIPPGEFRWIDIKREDLNVTGDPATGRAQLRTQPLWSLRTQSRLLVPTSLDLVDQNSGAGTFRFYIIVEALP